MYTMYMPIALHMLSQVFKNAIITIVYFADGEIESK